MSNLDIHHVVNDDLCCKSAFVKAAIQQFLTSKSVGSEVSQLRVQPTTGLNRAAKSAAKAFTALTAVSF